MNTKLFTAFMLIACLTLAACARGGSPGIGSPQLPGTEFPDQRVKIEPNVTDTPTASIITSTPAVTDAEMTPLALVDMEGVVKQVDEGLALIELGDEGGEFLLRFTDNTVWNEGINTYVDVGNIIQCRVKPDATFTTPAQGEVFEVLKNEPK